MTDLKLKLKLTIFVSGSPQKGRLLKIFLRTDSYFVDHDLKDVILLLLQNTPDFMNNIDIDSFISSWEGNYCFEKLRVTDILSFKNKTCVQRTIIHNPKLINRTDNLSWALTVFISLLFCLYGGSRSYILKINNEVWHHLLCCYETKGKE